MAATLATAAPLLVAAERRRRVQRAARVPPADAGPELLRHPEDARALLRPDAGREPVGGVVRLLDRLLRRAEGQRREHRPEDLLLRDPVALRHVRENGRWEEVAALREAARRLVDLRSLLLPARDELRDLVELTPR